MMPNKQRIKHLSRYKEIIKSSASILSSQAASALISIAFLAYFARVFSKEQMAVYATLTIFSSWNEVVGGLGMGTLMIKEVAGLQPGHTAYLSGLGGRDALCRKLLL